MKTSPAKAGGVFYCPVFGGRTDAPRDFHLHAVLALRLAWP
jgi:uncharacterized protein (UPF0305 family)